MKHSSPSLRFWAFAVAFALAFTQAAMAAYACPMSAQRMAAEMAMEGAGCPDGNPGSKTLCFKVCQDEPQKNQVPTLDALPPSAGEPLRVEMASPRQPSGHRAFDELLARATSPPASILYARFLI